MVRQIVLCLITIFVSLVLTTACSPKKRTDIEKDKQPIVSVYDKVLYKSELDDALVDRMGVTDSTQSANAYIKMWVNQELVYEQAKKNVDDEERINKLVENYRQSLIVFTYLEQLLKEELSNKLSESEIKNYYDENPNNFKLQSSLIKGVFLKIPNSSSKLGNLKEWYKQNTNSAKENIEKASIQNTVIYDYFYDKWTSTEDILSKMPIPITDVDQFIKANKNFETQDSSYVYLLHIEEYALSGTNAPYLFAKSQISDILINKNRESFFKQFEEDLYNKALKNEDIQYYFKQKVEEPE